jgi:enoyl-CoA hydratase
VTDDPVRVEDRDGVAVVRIDRPPANAMDLGLLEAGHRVLERLAADRPAAVVLTGREEFFSAGVDLKALPGLDADGQRAMVAGINRLFAGWYALPHPLVCAVNGHAIAGGLILALCGDHRVGATTGRLGLTELRAGVPYPAAAMEVVRAELTPAAARRPVLGAGLVEPAEALELGLVDELRPRGEVLARALEVAADLAALPAGAYAQVKRQLRGPVAAACERIVAGSGEPLLTGDWLSSETPAAVRSILGADARRPGAAGRA